MKGLEVLVNDWILDKEFIRQETLHFIIILSVVLTFTGLWRGLIQALMVCNIRIL